MSEVDRWFLRQGLPHLIPGYRASTDVYTRAAPALVLLLAASTVLSFSERLSGWIQASALAASLAIVGAAAVGVNRLRGRRAFALPERVGRLELAVFVVTPAIPAALFGDGGLWEGAVVIAGQLVLLGVVSLIVGYGLVPLTRWALVKMVRQLSQLFDLTVRTLPFLLLFATFLFLTTELWQVADDFAWPLYAAALALLMGAGAVFITLKLAAEARGLARFASWEEAVSLARAAGSPLQLPLPGPPAPGDSGADLALNRLARANVTLVVCFSVALQVFLVSALIGLFYVVFGLLVVRRATLEAWTGPLEAGDVWLAGSLVGVPVVLSRQLVHVCGFLVAFSWLNFAVSAVRDEEFRREFVAEVTESVRGTLAVRAIVGGLDNGRTGAP